MEKLVHFCEMHRHTCRSGRLPTNPSQTPRWKSWMGIKQVVTPTVTDEVEALQYDDASAFSVMYIMVSKLISLQSQT